MSFLPRSLTPALLRFRRHKLHITRFRASTKSSFIPLLLLSPKSHKLFGVPGLGKVVSHSDGHSILDVKPAECFREKQKEPITQSIRNRREHSSRFKMMFYVIGSEDQSRVLLSTAPANRTKGVVEQFGTSGVPIPCRMKPTNYVLIWSNISIQLLCMCG